MMGFDISDDSSKFLEHFAKKLGMSYSSANFHRPMINCDVTVCQLMTVIMPNLEIGHFGQPVSEKPV